MSKCKHNKIANSISVVGSLANTTQIENWLAPQSSGLLMNI
jgi:hypothetical protein